jgi:hypothetical protein
MKEYSDEELIEWADKIGDAAKRIIDVKNPKYDDDDDDALGAAELLYMKYGYEECAKTDGNWTANGCENVRNKLAEYYKNSKGCTEENAMVKANEFMRGTNQFTAACGELKLLKEEAEKEVNALRCVKGKLVEYYINVENRNEEDASKQADEFMKGATGLATSFMYMPKEKIAEEVENSGFSVKNIEEEFTKFIPVSTKQREMKEWFKEYLEDF